MAEMMKGTVCNVNSNNSWMNLLQEEAATSTEMPELNGEELRQTEEK